MKLMKAIEILCLLILIAGTPFVFVVKRTLSSYRIANVNFVLMAEVVFLLRNVTVLLTSYCSNSRTLFTLYLFASVLVLSIKLRNYRSHNFDLERETCSALRMFVLLSPSFPCPSGLYRSSYRGSAFLWRDNTVSKIPPKPPETVEEIEILQRASAADCNLRSKALLVESD